MVGLALREFECTLCQRRFTLLSGDLILPGPSICDECLRALWELEGDALTKHISGCLKEEASRVGERPESHFEERALVSGTVQLITWYKEQWGSAEEATQDRERERQALG